MARKPITPPLADMAGVPLTPNPAPAPDNLAPFLARLETMEQAIRILADVVQEPQPVTLSPQDVTLIRQLFSDTVGADLIAMETAFSEAKMAIEALPATMEKAEQEGKEAQARMGRAVAKAVRELCEKAGGHIKGVGQTARDEMNQTANSAKPQLDQVTEETKRSVSKAMDELRAAAITTAHAAKRELTASTAAAEDVQAKIGLTVSQLEKAMDDLDYCNPATSQNAERRLFRVGRYMALVTAGLTIAGFGVVDLIMRKYGL